MTYIDLDTDSTWDTIVNYGLEDWKMDPELKARWLEALRSGNYQQGNNALCKIDPAGVARYCCLGVLAETESMFTSTAPNSRFDGSSNKVIEVPGENLFYRAFLPDGDLPVPIQEFLADKNDNRGWDFDKIAAWVDANL